MDWRISNCQNYRSKYRSGIQLSWLQISIECQQNAPCTSNDVDRKKVDSERLNTWIFRHPILVITHYTRHCVPWCETIISEKWWGKFLFFFPFFFLTHKYTNTHTLNCDGFFFFFFFLFSWNWEIFLLMLSLLFLSTNMIYACNRNLCYMLLNSFFFILIVVSLGWYFGNDFQLQ